jgi:hypothetical protein
VSDAAVFGSDFFNDMHEVLDFDLDFLSMDRGGAGTV